jgi:hypothetical protein
MFLLAASVPPVADSDKLTSADPSDLAAALAFSLRYQGRKRRQLPRDQAACRFSAEDLPVRRSGTTLNAIFWPSLRSRMPARSTALI